MHRAAVPPQRRANGTHARAPRALLLPELFARAGHQLLVLGGVRAGALCGAVVLHRFPQQVLVDRAEDFVGQFEGANLGPAQIMNVDALPYSFRYAAAGSRPATAFYAFFAARLAAFNGSTVRRAANPRRSLRRLLRLGDNHVSAVRARHRAFHHQQVLVLVHAQHTQVADRDPLHAHVSGHAHALEHARRETPTSRSSR